MMQTYLLKGNFILSGLNILFCSFAMSSLDAIHTSPTKFFTNEHTGILWAIAMFPCQLCYQLLFFPVFFLYTFGLCAHRLQYARNCYKKKVCGPASGKIHDCI
eukprot:GHVL01033110.1.p1 GENE.GHVL01033110.1~~GHVL01033110.1.p1  ORF type:complete len:103 (+),score=2.06 GHVL01033110.1:245-553(+)